MPWRGLIVVLMLIGAAGAFVVMDAGARLAFYGPVEITSGGFRGVQVGDPEGEAIATFRSRFGEPTVIIPEPAPRFRIAPYKSYVFRDPSPFAAVIVLDVRDGRVFRISASYSGLWARP